MTTPPEPPSSAGGPGASSGPTGPGGPAGQGWQPQWQPQYNPQSNPPYPAGGYPQGPPPGYGYGYAAPDHPKAQYALILGVLGLVLCQVVAPFAWVSGKRTLAEIDASGGQLGGRSQAQTGMVLGIIGTVILGLGAALMVFYVIFMILVFGVAASGSS